MKALLIVDVQRDFLPGGSLAVPRGDEIISVLNGVQERFELVAATQDWHPRNHGSFASNHRGKKPFETTVLNGLEQILWPDHCVWGSAGAGFADGLDMERVEAIFRKGTDPGIDSYSGFFDNGHRKSTGLGDYLKGRGVKEVYVAGLAGDVCVMYTAVDALELGFSVTLLRDATRPLDEGAFEKALGEFQKRGGRVAEAATFPKAA